MEPNKSRLCSVSKPVCKVLNFEDMPSTSTSTPEENTRMWVLLNRTEPRVVVLDDGTKAIQMPDTPESESESDSSTDSEREDEPVESRSGAKRSILDLVELDSEPGPSSVKRHRPSQAAAPISPEAAAQAKRGYARTIRQNQEIFIILQKNEKKLTGMPVIPTSKRSNIINYMLKLDGPASNINVIHVACFFLDSILATMRRPIKRLHLVAAGCYWISQKMHGRHVTPGKMLSWMNFAYNRINLLAVENAIMRKLNYPCIPATADDFINYFAWWLDDEHPEEIELAASFIALASIMESGRLSVEYPSVIASTATMNALLMLKRSNDATHILRNPVYQKAEKKAGNFMRTRVAQRMALRNVSMSSYKLRTLYNYYDRPPHHMARRVTAFASAYAVSDRYYLNITSRP